MLDLFDYLTPEDNETFEDYVTHFGVPLHLYKGNKEYLKNWAESNKKLFHLLGGKLIYEVPFSFQKDYGLIKQEVEKLLSFSSLCDDLVKDVCDLLDSEFDNIKKDITSETQEKYLREKYWMSRDSLFRLCSSASLISNSLSSNSNFCELATGKILKLNKGTKAIKAMRKVIDFYGLTDKYKSEYEKFRIAHSLIFNEKFIKGTLCISIHPMDFVTMSDNNYGWSSCMNWTKDYGGGCYRLGTVEMMNSNNVVCAYLKGDEPFEWDDECSWTNKKWRQLFYVTKEIIVGGKAYPYQNKDFTFKILEILRELAKENWNQTYSFGIEPYNDMKHIHTYNAILNNQEWIRTKMTNKHNIIFHTKGMYNDMFNDKDTTYYCIRNKVKNNKVISYSGKSSCLCCNNEVLKPDSDYYYNDRFRNTGEVLCDTCRSNLQCYACDAISIEKYSYDGVHGYCRNCFNQEHYKCPFCGKIFPLSNLKPNMKYLKAFLLKEVNTETYKDLLDKYDISVGDGIRYYWLPNRFLKQAFILGCPDCFDKKVYDACDSHFEEVDGKQVRYSEPPFSDRICILDISLISQEKLLPLLKEGMTINDCFKSTASDLTDDDLEPYRLD